jgi:hypothetical protein
MVSRLTWVAFVTIGLVAGAVACKGKTAREGSGAAPSPTTSSSKLVDLSTSLDAVRATFNAHKQEARFLTLLSPA